MKSYIKIERKYYENIKLMGKTDFSRDLVGQQQALAWVLEL